MHLVLFEDDSRLDLLPLTYTRPVWDLRVGIDKLSEKWGRHWNPAQLTPKGQPLLHAAPYLRLLFQTLDVRHVELLTWVNGKFIPNEELLRALRDLPQHAVVRTERGELLAFRAFAHEVDTTADVVQESHLRFSPTTEFTVPETHTRLALRQPWDVFRLNGEVLRQDFAEITAGRTSEAIADKHTAVYGVEQVFLEPGAKVRAAVLNAETGPIYLGHGADVQEGALIHGAHAVLESAVVGMGAKLRGDSTIGPHCKVGGEVSNSVLWGYSNKGHDGFVGNSVLGAWCNLGADTNTSNLKNNYSTVRMHSHRLDQDVDTGLTFCGLLMADHAKCGINTMFNTGTVVGVGANVFGGGFPDKFIPSFAWGGVQDGWQVHRLDKMLETAERVLARRSIVLAQHDRDVLAHVFEATAGHRS